MHYRTLGRTGLKVSVAGLGTGGASKLGQTAKLSVAESGDIVRAALDLGINIFDSSTSYGESEARLGAGLVGVPRDRYVITTKFQPHMDGGINSDPNVLMDHLENSLRLLGIDALDVLQYHGVTRAEYREAVERFHPVALRAQEQGKVRFLGITETVAGDAEHEMLPLALEDDLFDTVMVKYGILNQGAREVVYPMVQARNVGVLVMASVRTSLRTPAEAVGCIGRFIEEGLLDMAPTSEADPLGLGAARQPVPSQTRAAYQFAAAHPAVSTVLIGTGNVAHLRANVADLMAPGLSPEQMAYLESTYGHLAWNA